MIHQLTINEKFAIVSILSQIMKADGIIHPKEEEYMDKVYEDFGITVNDIEDMANMNDIQAINIIKELSEEKQQYAQTMFEGMAASDGFVAPREMDIINNVFKQS